VSIVRHQHVGVVAIGRNEGQRLRMCLESALRKTPWVVYVDSGSTDGSVEMARSLNVTVVELDASTPFTAARARNAGIARLKSLNNAIAFVQVIDGDCELAATWMDAAFQSITDEPQVAIVCGRRRECNPSGSIYNKLCDMEWDTPVGDAASCGGDALIRLSAFDEVGGYDDSIIAGEEPELCVRLRAAGWRIVRISHEMTLHDARMSDFRQWWKRTLRSGHAYAEGFHLHGHAPMHHFRRQIKSTITWAVVLPLIALSLAWVTWSASLLLFLGYVALWWRVRRHRINQGDSRDDAELYARYCVLGKFAEAVGVGQYVWNRLRGRRSQLIEYHRPSHHSNPSPVAEGVRS
jgi:GT2 family glycosyltransferase